MPKPAPATVIALIALFVSLGGTTYAAIKLPANSVGTRQIRDGAVANRDLHTHAVNAAKVADNSLTGTQINSSTLGTVPSSTHAINADRAAIATRAANADHATNSDQLAGSPASTYLAHCPSALHRAPKTDLCFDFTERAATTWTKALSTCALAGLRLPDPGELAQVFDDLDAVQDQQWTDSQFSNTNAAASMMGQDSSRNVVLNADFVTRSHPYRCVTTASN
ncbi:MAG TPA: hypothetical protein VLJ44_09535 [Gaiellaceae bacterium]|nr:hypothetical protein [Gaiellaceae bacterium]